ncbi:MAG: hypothetical protein AAFY59_11940, partial [Pseudomonadota bacterium]
RHPEKMRRRTWPFKPVPLAEARQTHYADAMIFRATLLAAALAAPLPADAQSGRFPVFGNSPEREAFFENQATERREEAAELAKARAEAEERRLEAEREAALEAARRPAPALVTGPASVYNPDCVKPVNRDYQRPLTPEEGAGAGSVTVRRDTIFPCPPYRRVSPYPSGPIIILGPDGIYGRYHRPGLSINLTLGN